MVARRHPQKISARLRAALAGLLLLLPALVAAAPFAYIANSNSNTVSVIDTASNTVTATVAVGNGPFGVAVNHAGTRVYVANQGSNSVSVIDTASNTVVATVAVGNNPSGVAVNPAGTHVYVTNVSGSNVSVIDTASNTVVATVTVGNGPLGVAVSPAGTRVYVANASSNNVSVIDTASNSVVATVAVGAQPYGVAVNPAGTHVYVTNFVGNSVSVIDTASNTVTATVAVGAYLIGVAVNPAGTRVYVTNVFGSDVSVIDTASNSVVATVAVGAQPYGVAVNPAGTRVYVANQNSNSVSVIDTASNTVTATVAVGLRPSSLGQFIPPPDTTPDPFGFTAQTNVALSSVATSNAITVAGIDSAAAIGIAGGSYSINGGVYVSTAGTVNNGDTVTVQQTSSSVHSTLTTTTLTIGGVSGAFEVTTAAPDTTPDPFGFTAQTNVALSSVATSNAITVAGIDSAAAIGIAGGSYSINGGAYTTAAGTVNNGDTVTVQQTSSASFSTLTSATLTIGGVSSAFEVTTLAAPAVTTAPSATGTGEITASFTGGGAGCGYAVSQFISLTGHTASPPDGTAPAGVSFPHGLFDFTTSNCTPGSTITMIITYPQALPPNTVYWKYGPTPTDASYHWYQLPATIAGNIATFSITDGGLGDDDLTANGIIVDQGGPGSGGSAASIPTLSEWALLMLAGLMGLFGMGAMRRRAAL